MLSVLECIHGLDLDLGTFVVVGSAALTAKQIWPGPGRNDIDITVTPKVYAELQAADWHEEPGFDSKSVLRKGIFDVGISFGPWDVKDLLPDADYCNAVPYINIRKLRQWKAQADRPKDRFDVYLIDKYLEGKPRV